MRDIVAMILTIVVFAVLATGFVICTSEMPWSAAVDVGLMTGFLGTVIALLAHIFLGISGEAPDDIVVFALVHAAAGGIMVLLAGAGIPGALLVAVFGLISGLVGSLTARFFWRLAGSN